MTRRPSITGTDARLNGGTDGHRWVFGSDEPPPDLDPDDPEFYTEWNERTRTDDDTRPGPSSWDAVDITGYIDGTHTPPPAGVVHRTDGVGMLYPGLTNEFHGESESAKSLIAQWIARKVMDNGHRVVYLDYESDPGSVVGRLIALEAGSEQLTHLFSYRNPEQAAGDAGWLRLLAVLRPGDLVIVDGVNAAMATAGANLLDNRDVTNWGTKTTKPLERTGATVLLIDHVTKGTEGRGRFAIGAQAKLSVLTGASYVVRIVTPPAKGSAGKVELRIAKDRPADIRGHCGPMDTDRTQHYAMVTIDSKVPGLTTVTVEADAAATERQARPAKLMEAVSRFLENEPEPVAKDTIRTTSHITGRAVDRPVALGVLVTEGYVTEVKVKVNNRQVMRYESAVIFRAATDPGPPAVDP